MKKFFLVMALIIGLSGAVEAMWEACNNGLDSITSGVWAIDIIGNNIFAVTMGNGVFLSTDNGTNWKAVNHGLKNLNDLSITTSGKNVFIGSNGDGVFLSTDNGTNWKAVNQGLTNLNISSLAIEGNNIFAGTNGGIFLSTDNGNNWNILNQNLIIHCLTVGGKNIIAGSIGAGVSLSTDNGTNWQTINNGLLNHNVWSLAISGINIFAGTGRAIYLSTDTGTNWINLDTNFQFLDVYSLAISGNYIFAGTNGNSVYLSTDNGTKWNSLDQGLGNSDVYSLKINGNYIFAGTNGGVFRAKLSDVTDVKEYLNPSKIFLNISPNPSFDNISISFTNLELITNISIYNSLGKEIKRFYSKELSAKSSLSFSTEEFPSGIYYCSLFIGTNKITKSFVVVR